jgi:dipeptidyl aminopeptidase/acylaminoacyl peptidase
MSTAGYGRWASPLAATDVAGAKSSLSELCSDGGSLYWLESRPADGGRVVLVRADEGGDVVDHSPAGVSIRSRVHEYGGGAMCLVGGRRDDASGAGSSFAYVDQTDQRVWLCDGAVPTGPIRPLSDESPPGRQHRHGGLSATTDGAWVLAVREVHAQGAARPSHLVVALAVDPEAEPAERVLFEGRDFYGAPAVSRAGDRVAVVAWDHPDMPWDAGELLVQDVDPGSMTALGEPRPVAGGPGESLGQPAWQPDGRLRFVSDRRGWWQPFVADPAPGGASEGPLVAEEAEFHGPDWVLGQSTMAELPTGTLVLRRTAAGHDDLVVLDPATGGLEVADQPCVSIVAVCGHGEGVALIGATPDAPPAVWVWRPGSAANPLRRPEAGSAPVLGPADVARGEPFSLTGRSGRPVFGTLYRPTPAGGGGGSGSGARAGGGGPPPLVVWCHGGPTSSCQSGLDLTVQFFTSRGFAAACVDYAGSSGYGRAYRNALRGLWGVADAEDCLDAALHLATRGDVDRERMAIRGGSAGGLTALNALASGEGFSACVSWYGVTDLMGLVATTHDFEARYTDRLIGPLPEAEALYEERSPVSRAEAMAGSVLLLQGTEDPVVPPQQAERLRDALAAAGHACQLVFFEGESHGFRRAETLTACLEAELAFYLSELGL